MSCDWMRERLTADLDGELAAKDAERIADHLAGCESCRSERSHMAAALEMAASWEIEESDVWPAARNLIRDEELVQTVRDLRVEVAALRDEIAELRRELARRNLSTAPRRGVLPYVPGGRAEPAVSNLSIV